MNIGLFASLACAAPPPPSTSPAPSAHLHVFERERAVEAVGVALRANLRVSTATWPIDDLLQFQDFDLNRPLFVRLEPNDIEPIFDCTARGRYRFTPEPPLTVGWTWDPTEAQANDPVQGETVVDPVPVQWIAGGSYWLEGTELALLRQAQPCRATHVVRALRVGRALTGPAADHARLPDSASGHICAHAPTSAAPSGGCDLPLTLELIALDPFAAIVDWCPAPTRWDGWSCRSPEALAPDGLGVCLVASPNHPACRPGWPRETGWHEARPTQFFPDKLDARAIQLGFESVEAQLPRCLSAATSVHIRLSVEGPTGGVTHVEVASDDTTARCLADILFTARFPTFANPAQGIERTLSPNSSRLPSIGERVDRVVEPIE